MNLPFKITVLVSINFILMIMKEENSSSYQTSNRTRWSFNGKLPTGSYKRPFTAARTATWSLNSPFVCNLLIVKRKLSSFCFCLLCNFEASKWSGMQEFSTSYSPKIFINHKDGQEKTLELIENTWSFRYFFKGVQSIHNGRKQP